MKKIILATTIFVLLMSTISFAYSPQPTEIIHGRFLEYSFVPNENGQIVTVLKLVDETYNVWEFYYYIEGDLQDWVMYDYYFSFDSMGNCDSLQVFDGEILICDE